MRAGAGAPVLNPPVCRAASILLAFATPSFAANAAAGLSTDRDWYWCQLAEWPYGRTVYVSDVFSPPGGASETGVETAFEEHVERRYVREPVAGGLCLGPDVSREAARRGRQDALDSLRRDGVEIVRTGWQFRGSREGSFPVRSPR